MREYIDELLNKAKDAQEKANLRLEQIEVEKQEIIREFLRLEGELRVLRILQNKNKEKGA